MGIGFPALKGPQRKGQIALEFMIVYSLILIIFIIIFVLIADQRTATLSQQQSSLMELLAQSVAGDINEAVAAGNGYSATIPLSGGLAGQPYNISISSDGVVLATTKVGKELVIGEAFSDSKLLAINGTVVSSGGNATLYQIPSYRGNIYLANLNNRIYIDQVPPSIIGLGSNLLLREDAGIDAPYFSGANSVIVPVEYNSLDISHNLTLYAWLYMNSVNFNANAPYVSNPIISEVDGAKAPFILSVTNSGNAIALFNWNSGPCTSFYAESQNDLEPNQWYNIAVTYNGYAATIYGNGVPIASASKSTPICGPAPLDIGASVQNGTYMNGYLADVQIYNSSLTANQVDQLYYEGPSSSPLSGEAENLSGWWPLNGNPADYSGHGAYGTAYNVTYRPAVSLDAKLLDQGGSGVAGVPVGFWTANALFGGSEYSASETGINGTVHAFMSSANELGYVHVAATAFNGNTTTSGNLIRWWPINLGSAGNYVADISGNGKNGTFINSGYSTPRNQTNFLVGHFNGKNSSIAATTQNTSAIAITIAAWVEPESGSGYPQSIVQVSGNSFAPGTFSIEDSGYNGHAMAVWSNQAGSFQDVASGSQMIGGGPYFLVAEWNSNNNTVSIFQNGTLVGVANENGTVSTNIGSVDIGGPTAVGSPFYGYISNVQVYTTTLTQNQIEQMYAQGQASGPLIMSQPVGWWPADGDANSYSSPDIIQSSVGNNINYTADTFTSSSQSAFNSTSTPIFNGINSYVAYQPGVLPSSGICNLTIAAWSYNNGLGSSKAEAGVFNFSGDGEAAIYYNSSTTTFILQNATKANSWSVGSGSSGSWTMSALTLDSGVPTGYINNVAYAEAGSPKVGCIGLPDGVIGRGPHYFNGSIVDVQVYNISLSRAQLGQLWAQGPNYVATLNVSVS